MGRLRSLVRVMRTLAVLVRRGVSRGRSSVSLRRIEGGWRVRNLDSEEYYDFPRFPQSIHVAHIGNGYATFLGKKYQLEGFAELGSRDTVVDVGAFVGAFTAHARRTAGAVTAVEPERATASLLERRWGDDPAVSVLNVAVWEKSGDIELRLGLDASDTSVINVDKGEQRDTTTVGTVRLDELFDRINFLKLEAEGAEPEVLRGASECVIERVAVDASAERNGEPTVDEVETLLRDRGHETRVRGSMVFGRASGVVEGER